MSIISNVCVFINFQQYSGINRYNDRKLHEALSVMQSSSKYTAHQIKRARQARQVNFVTNYR